MGRISHLGMLYPDHVYSAYVYSPELSFPAGISPAESTWVACYDWRQRDRRLVAERGWMPDEAWLGFFTRTGFGTYKLNTSPESSPSTNPPDP
jgi:hypothetical protein